MSGSIVCIDLKTTASAFLVPAWASVLACLLANCASVHDATPMNCPTGQEPSGGLCVCSGTLEPAIEGSCPSVQSACQLAGCVDDDNPCTQPTCLVGAEACSNEPVDDSTACEKNAVAGSCLLGECVLAEPAPWEWGVPFRISTGGDGLSVPIVAVAANGEATALWSDGDVLMTANFDPEEGWRNRTAVEPAHVSVRGIALGTDALGRAVAVYTRLDRGSVNIVAEHYDPESGLWGSLAVIGEEASVADSPQVAVTPDGDIVAVWWEAPGHIALARGRTDSVDWEAAVVISPDDGLEKHQPSLSLADDGEGAVIYRATGAGSTHTVWVASLGVTSVGVPIQLGSSQTWIQDPRVAASPSGEQMAVWEDGDDLLCARYSEGAWGAPELLEAASTRVASPSVSVDREGDFFVAWEQDGDARARRFIVGDQAWEDTRILLVNTGYSGREPTVVAASNGAARLAWVQDAYVRMSRFEGQSGWAPFLKLSRDLGPEALGVRGPRLGVGLDGTEVIVWTEGRDVWAWTGRP